MRKAYASALVVFTVIRVAEAQEVTHTYHGAVQGVSCHTDVCTDTPEVGSPVEIQVTFDTAVAPSISSHLTACWTEASGLVTNVVVKMAGRTLTGPVTGLDWYPRKRAVRKGCGASDASRDIYYIDSGSLNLGPLAVADGTDGQNSLLEIWCPQTVSLPLSTFPSELPTTPTSCEFYLDNAVVNMIVPSYTNYYDFYGPILGVTAGEATVEEQIQDLAQVVVTLNLQAGIANSLDSKLDAISQAFAGASQNNNAAAVNMLHAFLNAVQAQRGKKLTNAQADQLVNAAQTIIDSALQ